ncbi:hypothetical protein MD484_g574, partial [Candolleomyces efflorescens]
MLFHQYEHFQRNQSYDDYLMAVGETCELEPRVKVYKGWIGTFNIVAYQYSMRAL